MTFNNFYYKAEIMMYAQSANDNEETADRLKIIQAGI